MSTLKQLLEKKHELHNQRETFQKELSSLFNQKDIFDIIKESLSEELSTTNISEDEVCVRLKIKQYKDKPNNNYYVLEFYQKLRHLYPSFLVTLELNESKDKLIVQLLEFTNYKLEMSKDEIIQHIKDLIGV